MTQPPSRGTDEQRLIRQVGRALLPVASEKWQEIRAEYRSAGRHVEVDVIITGEDGSFQPVRPPRDVVDLLGELRSTMYRPGRGTWLSGVYRLEPPAKYSAEFDPDNEPRWRRPPPPVAFQDELTFFPRDDGQIPEWLRTRARLPPTVQDRGDPTPTPPGGLAIAGQQGAARVGAPSGVGAPAGGVPGAGIPGAPHTAAPQAGRPLPPRTPPPPFGARSPRQPTPPGGWPHQPPRPTPDAGGYPPPGPPPGT